jgi:hypothetical protein
VVTDPAGIVEERVRRKQSIGVTDVECRAVTATRHSALRGGAHRAEADRGPGLFPLALGIGAVG